MSRPGQSAEKPKTARPSWRERVADLGVIGLLLVLTAVYFFPDMIVTINPGQAGVLWDRFFGGTQTNVVYGEGVHLIFPWNRMYLYDTRIQDHPHTITALSQHGLPIQLEVSIRYRPAGAPFEHSVNRGVSGTDSLGELHKRVGPDYGEKLVLPVVGTAARTVIGRYRADELYHMRRQEIQDEITKAIADRRSREEFAEERFVDIIDTLIRDITLPPTVREAIELKLAEEQAMLQYDFILQKEQKEAERKGIEAEGIRNFQQTVAQGVTPGYLRWQGINATLKLAESNNAKVVVIGGSEDGLPLILNLPDSSLQAGAGAAGPVAPADAGSAQAVSPAQVVAAPTDAGADNLPPAAVTPEATPASPASARPAGAQTPPQSPPPNPPPPPIGNR